MTTTIKPKPKRLQGIHRFAPARSPGKLSNVPSKFIRQVVADIKWVLDNPKKFTFDLSTWCFTNGKCTVCAAGAVIVRRLSSRIGRTEKTAMPDDVGVDTPECDLLLAANSLRCGNIHQFLSYCQDAGHKCDIEKLFTKIRASGWWQNNDIRYLSGTPSKETSLAWCHGIMKLAKILKAAGH
jgi:hypothetical protein